VPLAKSLLRRERFKGKPAEIRRCARNCEPIHSASQEPALVRRPFPRPGPAAGAWAPLHNVLRIPL